MYRWVDDKGVTNISDVVPDKYKKIAQRTESRQFDLSEFQRREVAARQAALAASNASSNPPAASASQPGVSPQLPRAAASAPTDNCAALQKRYKEAQDCFQAGPKNANGTIELAPMI